MSSFSRKFMDLPWPAIDSLKSGQAAALIPVGQIVQHGPHLPVGTDVFQAEGITEMVATELDRRNLPVIVGPTVTFGNSPAQECFPGFINLNPQTLTDQIEEIASCLARQGLHRQAYILFGPGSWWPLHVVSTRLARSGLANVIIIDGLQTARAVSGDVLKGVDRTAGKYDQHAGELETSLMLALRPDLVCMERAVRHYSDMLPKFASSPCTSGPLLQQMAAIGMRSWDQFGKEGVTGDATLATAEKGKTLIARLVTELTQHFQHYLFERFEQ
jgi:creatinine amidohydrolase